MNDLKKRVGEYYRYCRNRRIPHSILRLIPHIGDAVYEYIYGGDEEAFFQIISEETSTTQALIIEKFDKLLSQEEGSDPLILTVGGGNAETVLDVSGDIVLGNKHIAEVKDLIGGSSVNHSKRLLFAGYDVLPILAIGDDEIGRRIQKELLCAAKAHKASDKVTDYINQNEGSCDFVDNNIRTPGATIVVQGKARTIFTQKLKYGEHFIRHVERRTKYISENSTVPPTAVMVGHIQSDGKKINPQNPGETTKFVIEKYHEQSLIYTNFGNSQINLGLDYWLDTIPNIDIFQLNLEEAKRFFSKDLDNKKSLHDIVEKLRDLDTTAIITLDRFGAIGIHRELKNSIIIAWPLLDVKNVVDPTGAGDAFAAGVVSYLCERPDFSTSDFQSAIGTGRVWAAYACTSIGGAGDCPSQKKLSKFQSEIDKKGVKAIEVRFRDFAGEVMTLLDIAFQ